MAGAVGAFLAVSTVNGDPRLAAVVAFLIGMAFVILGPLLQQPAVIARVPRLRPRSYELNRVFKIGDVLKADIVAEVSSHRRTTPREPEFLKRASLWGSDVEAVVRKHVPGREHWFVRNLGPIEIPLGDDWYDAVIRYTEPRLGRLEELLRERG